MLTAHFHEEELGVAGCDQRLIDNAHFLCEKILEPIRVHYGKPVRVHDGYRDKAHNTRVGGKQASYHLYEGGHAAADFDVLDSGLQAVFTWIRLESHLPFDKVILETNSQGIPACIHIQVDRLNHPRREAFVGGTGNSTQYTLVEVR